MKEFLVGGAVRDQLLNLSVKDKDWVVIGATPENLLSQGYIQVGKDFPVFLHPTSKEEYALARTEKKSGSGYTGFICEFGQDITIEQDLERRDLTINAIAQDENGDLVDPFNGQQDIENKILRHISLAFTEDPLRVLRVARFAARFFKLGFTIAEETKALMSDIASSGELALLTPERVWVETEKALSEDNAHIFFKVLRDTHCLKPLFPEIDKLFGVDQRADYHPEIDTGIHTLMVIEQACLLTPDTRIRFAAATHDLGKGTTPDDILPRHSGHELRSVELVNTVCQRFKIPNRYREIALIVAEHHGLSHRAFELKASTIAKLFKAIDAYRRPDRLNDFLVACEADYRGRTGFEKRDYFQPDFLSACFKASAKTDISNLQEKGFEGKKMGDEIHRLRIKAIKQVQSDFVRPA
ncbi:MAG: multifunctional CCA addition/repair protein [Pseudomonadales bacterium]|nr:multifunctional CCA addition/repair protein [Pseudomonadales bacterium]